MSAAMVAEGHAQSLEDPRRRSSKAWLLFLPIVLSVVEWRVQGSARAPEGSTDIGKGLLLAVIIGVCVFLLGRIDRFRPTREGMYYFAYCGLALVSAQLTGAWEAPTIRIIRLAMTVLAVLLVSEIVVRSGGSVIEAYLKALMALLGVFLLEAILVPDLAWQTSEGTSILRLQGVLPGVDPNVIGTIGAIVIVIATIGAALKWRRRLWLLAIPLGSVSLILSRTRIPVVAGFGSILVALFVIRWVARSRRLLIAIVTVCIVAAMVALAPLMAWMRRDQPAELLINVSGRTPSWEAVTSQDRPLQEMLFGVGLGAKDVPVGAFQPTLRPIDSSWLATYWETGFFGVLVLATMVIGALIRSVRRSRYDPKHALAVGLYVFLLLWSVAETGFDDASLAVITVLVASTLVPTLAFSERSRPATDTLRALDAPPVARARASAT